MPSSRCQSTMFAHRRPGRIDRDARNETNRHECNGADSSESPSFDGWLEQRRLLYAADLPAPFDSAENVDDLLPARVLNPGVLH
jgi:hypothetical protein